MYASKLLLTSKPANNKFPPVKTNPLNDYYMVYYGDKFWVLLTNIKTLKTKNKKIIE